MGRQAGPAHSARHALAVSTRADAAGLQAGPAHSVSCAQVPTSFCTGADVEGRQADTAKRVRQWQGHARADST